MHIASNRKGGTGGRACKQQQHQQQQLQQQASKANILRLFPTATISRPAWNSVSGYRNACINYYLPIVRHLLPNAVASCNIAVQFPLEYIGAEINFDGVVRRSTIHVRSF